MVQTRLNKMASAGIRGVIAFLLLFMATMKTAEAAETDGNVETSRDKFTLTCPEPGEWYRLGKKIEDGNLTMTFKYDYNTKGLYYCKYNTNQYYYFYVQGKFCENCYEVDGIVYIGAIIMDILLTAVVMIAICTCTKKKDLQQPAHRPEAPGRMTRPAPGPSSSSHYQELNPHTRSGDTYSRMG